MKSRYSKESDLCAAFIRWAAGNGWKAYAETGGWDILLVNGEGLQIGVQAKLHFNATLMRQVLPAAWSEDHPSPDYRAIVLPKYVRDVDDICRGLGIILFTPSTFRDCDFRPEIVLDYEHDWCPDTRVTLPQYVPDCAAGASAPVRLTDWKIRALRVCAHIAHHGHIKPKQIRDYGVDSRIFTVARRGWLKPHPTIRGAYVLGEIPCPRQHPQVYQQILVEMAKGPAVLPADSELALTAAQAVTAE